MKNFIRPFILCTVLVCSKFLLAQTTVPLQGIELRLKTGGKTQKVYEVVFTPANATNKTITWVSSNTNVATVSAGTVSTVGGGFVTITAKSPELYQTGENTGKNIKAKVNLNVNYDKNFDKYAPVTGNGTNYYATGVSTTGASTNLSYTATSLPSDRYDHHTTGKLSVTKGETFTMTVTQNVSYSKTLVYFDWDGNGDWETTTPAEEGLLFGTERANTNNGAAALSKTITVPTDVKQGTTTRMRVVTVDAWSSHTKASSPRNEIGNSSTIDFDVEIIDNTAPAFSSGLTAYVVENSTGTAYTATATDNVSNWKKITFSLAAAASTNDNGLFNITSTEGNGLVTFKASPDYESPQGINKNNADKAIANTYKVQLTATDEANNSVTKDILIKVTDVDEIAPAFSSGLTAYVVENSTGTAYTATATDNVSNWKKITFSLAAAASTNDNGLFNITSTEGNGLVTFKASPDYESPQGINKNNADKAIANTYKVQLTATDEANNSVTKDILIKVTDVDEIAPNITSNLTVSVPENKTDFSYTITANEQSTFTLGTALDEKLFKLEGAKVSFKVAPDYENPKDADTDNVYKLELKATDAAGNEVKKVLSITVTDVAEQATIALPEALAFADTKVGETAKKVLTISNPSAVVLKVTAIEYQAGFTGDWQSGTIAAGAEQAVNVSFKPTEAKDYTARITVTSDAGSGINTLTVSGKGVLVTGIEPNPGFYGFTVFPNPAADVLRIKFPDPSSPLAIQLTNVNGQVVYERKAVTGDKLSLDVSGYKSGVYVLVLESGGKVTKRKVVIR